MATEILCDSHQINTTLKAHSAATTAKGFYVVGGNAVMAMNDADADADNVFVYEAPMVRVPKATGEAWTFGQKIYYSVANANFTTTSTSNTLAGIVNEDAASADAEGIIHLMPASVVNA